MTDKFQNKYRIPSARMAGWDYGSNALYFVTICTDNRMCCFGNIVNGEMQLSELGKIAHQYWTEIPNHFPFAQLGEFVVMPNHVHGIILFDKNEKIVGLSIPTEKGDSSGGDTDVGDARVGRLYGASDEGSANQERRRTFHASKKWCSGTLGVVLNQYKRICTIAARKIHADFAWQPRFHDHIIRTDESFQRISEYIRSNPSNWRTDQLYEEI